MHIFFCLLLTSIIDSLDKSRYNIFLNEANKKKIKQPIGRFYVI